MVGDWPVRGSGEMGRPAVVFRGSLVQLCTFVVGIHHASILQLSALHVAGQPICDRVTFCFGTARTKVRGHATSSFGPGMGGRDPVLHYSSSAGLPDALIGAPEVFA